MAQRPARHDPAPIGAGAEAARGRPQATAADRGRAGGELPLGRVHALLRDAQARSSPTTTCRRSSSICVSSSSSAACSRAPSSAKGNKGRRYTVHKPPAQRWTERLPFAQPLSRATASRSRPATRAASGRWRRSAAKGSTTSPTRSRSQPITSRASSAMLRLELAFYLGCLNLHERLAREGRADLLPDPARRGPAHARRARASTTSASRSTSRTGSSATTSTPTASRS